jgi:hypothetical protein
VTAVPPYLPPTETCFRKRRDEQRYKHALQYVPQQVVYNTNHMHRGTPHVPYMMRARTIEKQFIESLGGTLTRYVERAYARMIKMEPNDALDFINNEWQLLDDYRKRLTACYQKIRSLRGGGEEVDEIDGSLREMLRAARMIGDLERACRQGSVFLREQHEKRCLLYQVST